MVPSRAESNLEVEHHPQLRFNLLPNCLIAPVLMPEIAPKSELELVDARHCAIGFWVLIVFDGRSMMSEPNGRDGYWVIEATRQSLMTPRNGT